MYNIHSHYETIFHALKNIITHRRVFYLLPYGSTQPENIESITDYLEDLNATLYREMRGSKINEGPLLLFYDQEPILGDFNYPLFDDINKRLGPHILVTTEKDSDPLDDVLKKYNWKSVYYFHHAFAAQDWFRGYRYDSRLIPVNQRTIKKKFITFNRLTSNARVYRSLLINELVERNILDQGYVSYSTISPDDNADYNQALMESIKRYNVPESLASEAITNISKLSTLRIDNDGPIPNGSMQLSAVSQSQESFCHLVTETCYWERKKHLTEKIFKPIISRMPFVLVGPAHNLKYLREYGFKTFDRWIDESYDDIEDPILRMKAISLTMSKICSHSESELYDMLQEMAPVLEHNYNRFYSNEFLDYCWDELITNIKQVTNEV
jgi:hypothetical protein